MTPGALAQPAVLVVGLGAPDRGDDGVGPTVARLVADRVAEHGPDGVLVVAHEDPTTLVALMSGRRAVVVVDASSSSEGLDGSPRACLTARPCPCCDSCRR